ncbi:MAG: hypothetical protein ABIV27_01145 [Gemmatimonadales bacterium]
MRLWMTARLAAVGGVVAVCSLNAGCDHSEPFSFVPPPPDGSLSATSPLRLTYDPGSDDAASFSDDGKFIVYTFDVPGRHDRDRCLGIMPAGGGARLFERCETRVAYADSSDVYTSAALAADGRLLYLRGTSRIGALLSPFPQLHYAPTATAPGRSVLALPVRVGNAIVSWLGDIQWTGTNSFLGIAGRLSLGTSRDTVFQPFFLVRGTINGSAASLEAIPGTDGVTSYGLSEDGSQILIARNEESLELVPGTGGSSTPIATVPALKDGDRIWGLGCTRNMCIVSARLVNVTPGATTLPSTLYAAAITGGPLTYRAASPTARWTGPRLSPLSTDILVRARLGAARDLYLFREQP